MPPHPLPSNRRSVPQAFFFQTILHCYTLLDPYTAQTYMFITRMFVLIGNRTHNLQMVELLPKYAKNNILQDYHFNLSSPLIINSRTGSR